MTDEEGTSEQQLDAQATTEKKVPEKIIILFKAVPPAPMMKTDKYKISASYKFKDLQPFLREKLEMKESDSLVSF